jgi:hypothetical protein
VAPLAPGTTTSIVDVHSYGVTVLALIPWHHPTTSLLLHHRNFQLPNDPLSARGRRVDRSFHSFLLLGLLTTVLERELLPAPATLEGSASFRPPVGFASQEEQLLPASTIYDDARRAIDEAFEWGCNRNVLHATHLSPSLHGPKVAGCTIGSVRPIGALPSGRSS